MHDVRLVDDSGNLILAKIRQTKSPSDLRFKENPPKPRIFDGSMLNRTNKSNTLSACDIKVVQQVPEKIQQARIYQFGQVFNAEDIPVVQYASPIIRERKRAVVRKSMNTEVAPVFLPKKSAPLVDDYQFGTSSNLNRDHIVGQKTVLRRDVVAASRSQVFSPVKLKQAGEALDFSVGNNSYEKIVKKEEVQDSDLFHSLFAIFSRVNFKKTTFSFSGMGLGIFLLIISIGFFNKGLKLRDSILGTGKEAYINLALAKDGMLTQDFQKSSFEFSEARDKFTTISHEINDLAGIIVPSSRYIPFLSKLSSGNSLAQAGRDVSRIGILAGEIMQTMDTVKNPLNKENNSISFLEILKSTDNNLREILTLVGDAEDELAQVNVDDIPEEQRVQFVELRSKLPEIKIFISSFLESSEIMADVLGENGPRKYLFLFQNNQEMRATGGFIGTYGILDIFNGRVRNFFIDGIYNPDGQLREKIVPPVPIQKMSATWSLHDSNWFPDFPKSAEKAAWFYEKTGGPTVDGVITMTPNVMQSLLAITGPIEMENFGVTVDKDNFVETVQQEVEVDYDKEVNQPKKILAELAPKILDKIFNARSFSDMTKTLKILVESLNEKQILIYSKNYEVEKMLSEEGWSGEILNTQKDYLSVINTNINGYKTDGVIDEQIRHQAEIQADGSIVDTVTITRHHNGGNLEKDWWNKVNANYMRVYVPKGSTLIAADGQTREFNTPPLDYKKLAFKWDPQIRQEEDSMYIDEESGTRVYEDSEKTVFANWVYVSPQETVVVTYKYLLPFKIDVNMVDKSVDTYSLLTQKQSGSLGSAFIETVIYPESLQTAWSYPMDAEKEDQKINLITDLKEDKFLGVAFTRK